MNNFTNRDSYEDTIYTEAWLANHYFEKFSVYPFYYALKGVVLESDKVLQYLENECELKVYARFNKYYDEYKYIDNFEVYYDERNSIFISVNNYMSWKPENENENGIRGVLFFYQQDKQEIIDSISKVLLGFIKPKIKQANVSVIIRDRNSLLLNSYPIKELDLNVELNYNDDFKEIDSLIQDRLNQTDKGIILLHGEPGTGKTSYVRYLSSVIDKKIIFMPPSISEELSSPDFLSFMLDNGKESVLLIEDGEEVIKSRKTGGSSAINNLLNISDGILGDILNCQIIVTFNGNLKDIDEALYRKGRIIALYEFRKLEKGKAIALARHLGKSSEKIAGDMLLTDIYHMDELAFKAEKRKIGF